MRKLKLQMQLSLDGYACGPNGELDWMIWDWNDDLTKCLQAITDPVDTILLGRKTAADFIPHWTRVAADPQDREYAFGVIMNDTRKIIFSKTLTTIEGKNAHIMSDMNRETINALKAEKGGDIIVYGGVETVANLLRLRLIDELNLFINPVIIGKGRSVFQELEQQKLKLINTQRFANGETWLQYLPL